MKIDTKTERHLKLGRFLGGGGGELQLAMSRRTEVVS
jgi:hypothetical protein